MTGRHTRRWFAAIPITGRFYIMFAILVLCEGGVLFGALRAMELQSEASTDLARVAAVQRSLDRALTMHTSIATESQSAATPPEAGEQNLLNALRAQLDLTWALPATAEVASITDSLRQPAAKYFESAEANLRESAGGATAWAFADLEPRRAALETAMRDAMTRMRSVSAARRDPRARRSESIGRDHCVGGWRGAARGLAHGAHDVGHRAFDSQLHQDRRRGGAGAGGRRHGQSLRRSRLRRSERAGAHDQPAGRHHAGHADAPALRGGSQHFQQPAGRSAGNGGLRSRGRSRHRARHERDLRRASDGAAAGRFLARAPGTRLRASQDRFAQLRGGIAVQLHRRAPRASADLPRRRGAQCLSQVVRAHGRLDCPQPACR